MNYKDLRDQRKQRGSYHHYDNDYYGPGYDERYGDPMERRPYDYPYSPYGHHPYYHHPMDMYYMPHYEFSRPWFVPMAPRGEYPILCDQCKMPLDFNRQKDSSWYREKGHDRDRYSRPEEARSRDTGPSEESITLEEITKIKEHEQKTSKNGDYKNADHKILIKNDQEKISSEDNKVFSSSWIEPNK